MQLATTRVAKTQTSELTVLTIFETFLLPHCMYGFFSNANCEIVKIQDLKLDCLYSICCLSVFNSQFILCCFGIVLFQIRNKETSKKKTNNNNNDLKPQSQQVPLIAFSYYAKFRGKAKANNFIACHAKLLA